MLSQEALALWFIGFCCLVGKEYEEYWLLEYDPNLWAVYLWIKRN